MRDGRKVGVSCVPTLRRRRPSPTNFQSTNKKWQLKAVLTMRWRVTASMRALNLSVKRSGERSVRPECVRVVAQDQRAVILLPRRA